MRAGGSPGRGIALLITVFVLMVVAAVVAGTFFAALQEFRVGRNSVLSRRAFDAAEAGLDAALARWSGGGLGGLDSAGSLSFSGPVGGGAGSYAGTVERLNPHLFLMRSTGRAGVGGGEGGPARTVALVARLVPVQLDPPAALTAAGPVTIGASALVNGLGEPLPDWDCAGEVDSAAGVAVADSGGLQLVDCSPGGCVRGNPPIRVDPAIGSGGAGVPVLGESGWAELLALADTTFPAGGPTRPADGSWPAVVRAAGDLHVDGGTGHGVLLVEGDLVLSGGAVWVGLVAVRGTLLSQGAGGGVKGAVLAGAVDLGAPVAGGTASAVAYSACAVRHSLEVAAPVRKLLERGWAELAAPGG